MWEQKQVMSMMEWGERSEIKRMTTEEENMRAKEPEWREGVSRCLLFRPHPSSSLSGGYNA